MRYFAIGYTRAASHIDRRSDIPITKLSALHAGLQQFVAQSQLEEAVQKEAAEVTPKPGALGSGKDKIYVGKGQYIKVRFYYLNLRSVACV